jgi:hypothetical protein
MQIWHDRCKIFNSYWYLKKKKKKKKIGGAKTVIGKHPVIEAAG